MEDLTLPTFLVIGAPKSGTSTLHSLLSQLPDVYMSEPKEIQYFSHPEHPDFPLRWYAAFFAAGAGRRHRAESSPTYAMFPAIRDVPRRIHAMNPNIKLIYLVRDPVDRMVSAYAQSRHLGFETAPLSEAIMHMAHVGPSMYWLQVSEYLRWFDPAQIHVEFLDDLGTDPQQVLERIGAFLDVDVPAIDASHRLNTRETLRATRPWYARVMKFLRPRGLVRNRWQWRVHRSRIASRPLRPEDHALDPHLAGELRRLFAIDLRELAEFLDRPLPPWSHAYGLKTPQRTSARP